MLSLTRNTLRSGMRLLLTHHALVVCLALTSACNTPEPAPVTTLHYGDFQVELLAPEGVLEQGPNTIQLQVREGQMPVSFTGEHLVFTMPHAGGQSYMERAVDFSEPSITGIHNGQVTFDMPGRWRGQLHLEVPDDIIAIVFEVDVVETIR